MRFVRNFIIVTAVFLSLASLAPAHAVDSLFAVPGCDDPTKPCQTTGDGVNTIIQLTQSQKITADVIGTLLGKSVEMNWLGTVKPLNDSYNNENKKLETFGAQVQSASDNELNPAALQAVEQHDTSSKSTTMTSRVCVTDPTSKESKSTVSNTVIVSSDQKWLTTLNESARRTSSFTTPYTQESQDYRLPETTIKTDAALPCDSPLTGEDKPQEPATSQFLNDYTGNIASGLGNILYPIINTAIQIIYDIKGNPIGEQATTTGNGTIVGTVQSPYSGHTDALVAGCATKDDLNSVSYATDDQKQKLCDAGGFVNSMYRMDSVDPAYSAKELNAKDPNQQWDETITHTQPTAPNSNPFAARIEASGDYMNCALTQADYQNTQIPDGSCNTNWTNPNPPGGTPGTQTGDWNCNTSVSDQSVSGLNKNAAQTYVNNWYRTCANATANAWGQCVNDAIARSKAACIDPLFTLAIWIHETGASNYQCSGATTQDFGVNISSLEKDFSAQINKFLQLPSAYAGRCQRTVNDFFSQYGPSPVSGMPPCYNQAPNQAAIRGYAADVQTIYHALGGSATMPYPIISGCTPSFGT